MFTFFLSCFVFGTGLLLISWLGGDTGADVDAASDAPSAFKLLSLRSVSYFLFGFGTAGAVSVHFLGLSTNAAVGIGLVSGGALAVVAGLVFRYLHRSESGHVEPDAALMAPPMRPKQKCMRPR